MSTLHTSTDASLTRVVVERGTGGRPRVWLDADAAGQRPVIRPLLVPVPGSDRPRVSLVPDGALLLAGDHIRIEIRVEEECALDLVEPGGTVAYDMRGGSARWNVDIDLGARASLSWAGEPFVVAAGADVVRTTALRLGDGARAAIRETVVLGRHSEPAEARIRLDTRIVDDADRPLLVDGWTCTGAEDPLVHVGGARVIGSVVLVGADLPLASVPASSARLDLERGGALVRRLADRAHLAHDDRTWTAAREAVR